jgi:hypothetical protein
MPQNMTEGAFSRDVPHLWRKGLQYFFICHQITFKASVLLLAQPIKSKAFYIFQQFTKGNKSDAVKLIEYLNYLPLAGN